MKEFLLSQNFFYIFMMTALWITAYFSNKDDGDDE